MSRARDGSLVQLLFEDSAGSIIEHGNIIYSLLVLAVTMAGIYYLHSGCLAFVVWVFSAHFDARREMSLFGNSVPLMADWLKKKRLPVFAERAVKNM